MKLKKTIFYLLLSVIFSCTSSDIEEKTSTEETSTEETSTLYVTDEVTGEFLKEVLDNLKISDLSYNYNNETSNKTSNRGIAIECNHAIEDRTENKDYDFDLTRDYLNNPLSDSEIQDLINAPINSTTESSIKYFSSNGAPTTDCDTEEFEAPILNYDARDGLLRPIAFTYSNIFDYYGEHHFANVYRIKRTEKTTFRGASIPSIVLNTEGVVEKRVDRYHQVHAYTSKDQIYKEDLNLFMKKRYVINRKRNKSSQELFINYNNDFHLLCVHMILIFVFNFDIRSFIHAKLESCSTYCLNQMFIQQK